MERGEINPTLSTLHALSKALNINFCKLLTL
ncbi:helix-turn-helix domain-containing protein [Pontibacter korlensis]